MVPSLLAFPSPGAAVLNFFYREGEKETSQKLKKGWRRVEEGLKKKILKQELQQEFNFSKRFWRMGSSTGG